jgi:Uma2 family endonuclease
MSSLPAEEKVFTYNDYKQWDLKEGERYELIYGVAYAMSAPGTRHQLILMELSSQFYIYLRDKPCKVIPSPFDVRLFYKEDESPALFPDLTIQLEQVFA